MAAQIAYECVAPAHQAGEGDPDKVDGREFARRLKDRGVRVRSS